MPHTLLDDVLERIAQATVKNKILNGVSEARGIVGAKSGGLRDVFVEAIAIKALRLTSDTSPVFAPFVQELQDCTEATGRPLKAPDLDKIVGAAVKAVRAEELLGPSEQTRPAR